MPFELNMNKQEIIDNYQDQQIQSYSYGDLQTMHEESAKEVLGEDFDTIEKNLHDMNGMDVRACLYTVVVLAKMQTMDQHSEPYSVEDLADLSHESKISRQRISAFLKDMTSLPVPERKNGETDEAYEARKNLPETQAAMHKKQLEKFNTKFFKPAGDKLAGMMEVRYKETAELPMKEQLEQLAPLQTLTEGLYDAYSQHMMASGSDGIDKYQGYKLEDLEEVASRIDVVSTIQIADFQMQKLPPDFSDDDMLDYNVNSTLINRQERKYYYKKAPEELDKIRKYTPAEQRERSAEFKNNGGGFMTRLNADYAFHDHGLTGLLTPEERLTMALDPELTEMLTIEQKQDGTPRMMLGDIDMQLDKASEDIPAADQKKLKDLKLAVADAAERQKLSVKAAVHDMTPDSLKTTSSALGEAQKLLSDRTHWYNSSSNYRAMQDRLTELKEYTEKIAETGKEPTLEQKQKMLELNEKAKQAAETYLQGKGAADGKMSFKNDYETRRVSGARTVLGMLKSQNAALKDRVKESEFRDRADKIMGIVSEALEKGGVPLKMTPEQKAEYGSPKRLALHEKAAASQKETADMTKWVIDKDIQLNQTLPITFNRAVLGYLKPGKDQETVRENVNTLKIMGGQGTGEMYAKEQLFFNGMNRANRIDADQVDLTKHSMEEIVDFSIAHNREMIIGFDVQNARLTENSFKGMTLKESSKKNFETMVTKFERVGGMGRMAVTVLADSVNCMLPLDRMDLTQTTLAVTALQEHAQELGLSSEDIRSLGHGIAFGTQVQKLQEMQKGGKTEVSDITEADFDHVVTKEDVRRDMESRAAENTVNREREVSAPEIAAPEKSAPVNDGPALR